MKIVQINATCGKGSTGKICTGISKVLSEKGIENYILYSSGETDHKGAIKYMSRFEEKLGALLSRIIGNWGFNSYFATHRLIRHITTIAPDIVHLHNIHAHNCNVNALLGYLKSNSIKTVFTFHDCWMFTGYCMHYDMHGCEKWKTVCSSCPLKREYSWFFDNSKKLHQNKLKALWGLDLTVVAPSEWMAKQIEDSLLKCKNVRTINNGIDLETFKRTKSDFRSKNGLNGKYVVLGVAYGWDNKKGLDVFKELSKRLDDEYRIVLVGVDETTKRSLPDNILAVSRTHNRAELAAIYSSADVFVNPTREETFPTVNIEALACGTPVLTFETGGSSEIIDCSCGSVVKKNDADGMEKEVRRICKDKPYSSLDCLKRARRYDMYDKFLEYYYLYEEINDRVAKG